MAVRIGVGERRVVDDLDAGRPALDEEQRREALAVRDHVGDDDVDRRDVARRDEPLLAVDAEAAVRAHRGGRDRRRVRARVLLGHRVGVLRLAAQAGLQPPLDLVRRAVREDVVRRRDVPREPVRRAPELLLDEAPLDVRPALPAVLDRVQAAVQARVDRGPADDVDLGRREHAAGALGHLLARHEDVLDEPPRALLQLALRRGELEAARPPSRRLQRAARRVAPAPAARQAEQEAGLVAHDVAHDTGRVRHGGVVAAVPRRGELGRLAQPCQVRRLAAAQDERLGAGGLARDVRDGAAGAQDRDGRRQLALRLGSECQPRP